MRKPIDMSLGLWWKFTRYELRDGYIRPARGAKLLPYNPWQAYERAWENRHEHISSPEQPKLIAPYSSLLGILDRYDFILNPNGSLEFGDKQRYDLTEEAEMAILKWCSQYGLLGLLLQQARTVYLAPRWEAELANVLRHTQRYYVRTHTRWADSMNRVEGIYPLVQYDLEKSGELLTEESELRLYPRPGVLLQNLHNSEFKQESFSETWSIFFPDIPQEERETYQYPLPLSEDFWQLYAEPVREFLRVAKVLSEAISRLAGRNQLETPTAEDLWNIDFGSDLLNEFVAPVGLVLSPTETGNFQQQWTSPSLLASFATMALIDLTKQRLLRCLKCDTLFNSEAYQSVYCSNQCRSAAQKQRYRERHPNKAKDQQRKDYELRVAKRKEKANGKARTK